MKSHQEVSTGYQADFFRTELSHLLDPKHPMVKVAAGMDWEAFWNSLGKNMASGIGASRGEYTIDGVVAVSQVRPRPERRGGAGDVGGSL